MHVALSYEAVMRGRTSHPSTHIHRLVMCASLAASLAFVPSAIRAQDVTVGAVGGTGGDPYTLSCGTKAMAGIGGQAGGNLLGQPIIYNLYLWCITPDADGDWFKGNLTTVGKPVTVGKPGPSDSPVIDLICPSHYVVSGIKGQAGSYVSGLEILCSRIVAGAVLSGSAQSLSAVASPPPPFLKIQGSGLFTDPSFGPALCPQNLPGKGLSGRAHDWIDRVSLTCGTPTMKAPALVQFNVAGPSPSAGGRPMSGHMGLNAPALTGGVQVTLSQQVSGGGDFWEPPLPGVTFTPNPVIIPAGQVAATFAMSTPGVTSSAILGVFTTISGTKTLAGYAYVDPPSINKLSLSATTTSPGASVTGTLVMYGKAFTGGLAVQLTTGDASVATVPASVIVPQGDSIATFAVTVGAQSANKCTLIRADYNTIQKSTYLAVVPVGGLVLKSKLPISLVASTGSSQVTVSFPLASATPRTATMASSNPSIVNVPSTVTIPANATSVKVGLTISNPGGSTACVSLTASDARGSSDSVILILQGTSVASVAP
jgi:hypothetical protein